MLYLKNSDNTFTTWTGQPIKGIQYPLNIENIWNPSDLEVLGLYFPEEADPVPDGKYIVSTIVTLVGGIPKFVNTLADETSDMINTKKTESYSALVNLANQLTNSILNSYPDGEKQLWLAKEAESRAFLAIDEASRTSDDAPILKAVCQAQFGPLSEEDYLTNITNKANAVVQKADQWHAISAYVEGFRSKYDLQIDVITTRAEADAIIATATAELAAVAASLA